MCGRNSVSITAKELAEIYDADKNQSQWDGSYNIPPSTDHPVLGKGSVILEDMEWNFIPSWADSYKEWSKKTVINARIETIDENNLFTNSYKERRCLIPSTGLYEWKGDRGSKQPYFISPTGRKVFSFAGIWASFEGREKDLHTFVILTMQPNQTVGEIHSRMPVILDEENEEKWLKGELGKDEIPRYPDEKMESQIVSEKVNDPEYDSEDAIKEPTNLVDF